MKAQLRSAVVALGAIVGSFGWPAQADACSCVSYPNLTAEQVRHRVEVNFDRAAAVFTGEVVSADHLVAVLRIDRVWKGEIGSEARMRHATPMSGGSVLRNSCDYTFDRGKKYLVFGSRASSELMYAERCGSTDPLELADETIKVLATILAIRQGQESDGYARFLALEESWMKALRARDMPRLEALLAPEFTILVVGSSAQAPVVDRTELLRNVARYPPLPDHEVRIVKVHERGDMAVVHCVLRATYPPKSITPDGGELHFLVTDVWIKRGAAWQVLARHWSLAR